MSRRTLRLFSRLNEVVSDDIDSICGGSFRDIRASEVVLKDSVESAAHKQETSITRNMTERLNTIAADYPNSFTAKSQATVLNNQGKFDILFCKPSENQTKGKRKGKPTGDEKKEVPIGLLEVGLAGSATDLDSQFWKKVDQVSNYLLYLRQDEEYDWNSTLLLGVLVATKDWSQARLAIFSSEPKGERNWRIALLWRKELNSLKEISKAFGLFVTALVDLATFQFDKTTLRNRITYLGPNCIKVTTEKASIDFTSALLESIVNLYSS